MCRWNLAPPSVIHLSGLHPIGTCRHYSAPSLHEVFTQRYSSVVPVLSTGTKNNFSTINLYFSYSSKTGTRTGTEFYCIVGTRARTSTIL